MSQQPTVPTTPQQNDLAVTPLNDIERELVRNLLGGMRRLARRGIQVQFEWCKVRRAPRARSQTMLIELDPATFDDMAID